MSEKLKNSTNDENLSMDAPETTYSPEESAREAAEYWADSARDIEKQFGERIGALGGEQMSQKEFERWEQDYAEYCNNMENKIHQFPISFQDECEVKRKIVAYPGAGREAELKNTIEAQAGNYYYERRTALKKAIEESGKSDEEKEKELLKIEEFYSSVMEHVELKWMTPDDVNDYGPDRYERRRTQVHNDAMKNLNRLNILCDSYRMTPFTARNFCPSDASDASHRTGAEATLMRYDRDIVEEYYAIAFPDASKKAEARYRRETGQY